MFVLYYSFVAAIIKDNQKTCEIKIQKLKSGINKVKNRLKICVNKNNLLIL
jgi:hypothetical protein